MHPLIFVAGFFVWLALIALTLAMCRVAAKADEALEYMAAERTERREFDALVQQRAAAVQPEPLHLVESPAAVYRMADYRDEGAA